MRFSHLLAPTLREAPTGVEGSHRLMVRAGLLRRMAPGFYGYLPLGQRVVDRLAAAAIAALRAAGGQAVGIPSLRPVDPDGRVPAGPALRVKDTQGRRYALEGPAATLVTDLVRQALQSHRQLPVLLYQAGTEYRDHPGPGSGPLGGREGPVIAAWAFGLAEAWAASAEDTLAGVCRQVLDACRLDYRLADAAPVPGGPAARRELVALGVPGEAVLLACAGCGYAARPDVARNRTKPAAGPEGLPAPDAADGPRQVATPGLHTVDQVVDALGVPASRHIKTLLYLATSPDGDRELVAALVRGDRSLDLARLRRATGAVAAELAPADQVMELTGATVGSVGPVGLRGVRVLADPEVMALQDAVCGANVDDHHLVGVVPGRDFQPSEVVDLRTVSAGESCPACGAPLEERFGAVLGEVARWGTGVSRTAGATVADGTGAQRPLALVSCRLSLAAVAAAIVEQHHDAEGIVWPPPAAPFDAVVIPINYGAPDQRRAADEVYGSLARAGLDVLLDDRPVSAGVKFKDGDLIGFPVRVVLGPRTLAQDQAELVVRSGGHRTLVPLAEVADHVRAILA